MSLGGIQVIEDEYCSIIGKENMKYNYEGVKKKLRKNDKMSQKAPGLQCDSPVR